MDLIKFRLKSGSATIFDKMCCYAGKTLSAVIRFCNRRKTLFSGSYSVSRKKEIENLRMLNFPNNKNKTNGNVSGFFHFVF